MRSRRIRTCTALLVLLMVVGSRLGPAARDPVVAETGNIVVNGSFERGVEPGVYALLNAGSKSITGWAVFGTIDYIGTYWKSHSGNRSLDLNGVSPGGIQQTLPTIKGRVYTVTFWMAGNWFCVPAFQKLRVTAGGATTGAARRFTFDSTGATAESMRWSERRFTFTAGRGRTPLRFQTLTKLDCGPALDLVRVVEWAPAP